MDLPPPTSAAAGWRPTLMPTVAMIIREYVRVQQYHASTRTPVTTNLSIARSALASHLRVHDGHARRPTSPRPSSTQRPRDLPPHRHLPSRHLAPHPHSHPSPYSPPHLPPHDGRTTDPIDHSIRPGSNVAIRYDTIRPLLRWALDDRPVTCCWPLNGTDRIGSDRMRLGPPPPTSAAAGWGAPPSCRPSP